MSLGNLLAIGIYILIFWAPFRSRHHATPKPFSKPFQAPSCDHHLRTQHSFTVSMRKLKMHSGKPFSRMSAIWGAAGSWSRRFLSPLSSPEYRAPVVDKCPEGNRPNYCPLLQVTGDRFFRTRLIAKFFPKSPRSQFRRGASSIAHPAGTSRALN